MKTVALTLLLTLTGCASTCREACLFGVWGPGSASFDAVAYHYDTQDACQHTGKPQGYELPGYCGAGRGYRRPTYIYNNTGQKIATVK